MTNRLTMLISFLLILGAAFAGQCAAADPPPCLLCGNAHTAAEHSVLYKGRAIPLCSPACQEHFRELERTGGLDPLTAGIEPRAALFQADSAPQRLGGSRLPFWIGCYVLLGVLTGGGAAFVAVRKGIPAGSSFAIGFALNVIGLAIVLAKPARETEFHVTGLRKVPTTRASLRCPDCGKANHPSANLCLHCGRALEPLSRSEVNPT
ncbi:MAG: hypothetical protein HKN20_12470 [Gemmatimonadetes bacterium]|nr:hypothetical protein [Gemmatimonadota bacterium]